MEKLTDWQILNVAINALHRDITTRDSHGDGNPGVVADMKLAKARLEEKQQDMGRLGQL